MGLFSQLVLLLERYERSMIAATTEMTVVSQTKACLNSRMESTGGSALLPY